MTVFGAAGRSAPLAQVSLRSRTAGRSRLADPSLDHSSTRALMAVDIELHRSRVCDDTNRT